VAIGLTNEQGSTPDEKNCKIELFPWDIPQKLEKSWPPPAGAGNYAGQEMKNGDWPYSGWPIIDGYNDGYPRTSPVGSFEANSSGLYDMSGNVRQWCEDWVDSEKQKRVMRGASWVNSKPNDLLASSRISYPPDRRGAHIGFRCVLARESVR
jgi:formylglycine-generating enzyme required for sulfatase activity